MKNQIIIQIAKDNNIETLNEMNHDDSDFHDLHVLQIKEMLEKAYEAGQRASTVCAKKLEQ